MFQKQVGEFSLSAAHYIAMCSFYHSGILPQIGGKVTQICMIAIREFYDKFMNAAALSPARYPVEKAAWRL